MAGETTSWAPSPWPSPCGPRGGARLGRPGHGAKRRRGRRRRGFDIDDLPWPEPAGWSLRVSARRSSPRARTGRPSAPADRHVALSGPLLARRGRGGGPSSGPGGCRPRRDRRRLAGGRIGPVVSGARDRDQLLAVETAVGRRFTVIVGGPGTGKTTTVARLLAVLHELPAPAASARPSSAWPRRRARRQPGWRKPCASRRPAWWPRGVAAAAVGGWRVSAAPRCTDCWAAEPARPASAITVDCDCRTT